jgi:hypothetical protein
VPFHVFRHIKADEFYTERGSKLFCHFGLAYARRAGKQVTTDRLFGLTQPGARELD